MLLKDKTAVVYGASGAVGAAVATSFARHGALVFLAARDEGRLRTVAERIGGEGVRAEVAAVDVRNESAVTEHVRQIVARAGRIDVAFDATSDDGEQGTPLVEMSLDSFLEPVRRAVVGQMLIAKAVGPHMIAQGAGVVMTITAGQPVRQGAPGVGSFGVVCAAKEGFARQLSTELGPYGVRSICLRSSGSVEAPGLQEVLRVAAEGSGLTPDDVAREWAKGIALRRFTRLTDVGDVAALLASDLAGSVTAALVNATCGAVVD
jgi:3-oxoacyl-[acyl-carrier protein] reductase